MAILLKLLLAHVLSDFVFQGDKMCDGKQKKTRNKHVYQLLHGLIHALTSYLFVADWHNWIIPLVIFVSHTLIDYVKVEYMKKTITSFVIDQLVHIAVIVALWLSVSCHTGFFLSFLHTAWGSPDLWALATAYALMLKPTSVFLGLFIKRWNLSETLTESLPNAGKWIGYFERLLILTFILAGYAEGIGFLLAAKSIFRFGELSKAQEIKTTEYVLIGTFASFTIAIVTGFAVLQIIK